MLMRDKTLRSDGGAAEIRGLGFFRRSLNPTLLVLSTSLTAWFRGLP
jgi:hypothetical protein